MKNQITNNQYNISHDEYIKRTSYNKKLLENIIKKGDKIERLLTEAYTYDSEPGEIHWSLLHPKWADIIPSVFLGQLAIVQNNNGADGISYCKTSNTFIETEYKICTVRSSKIEIGPKGGLNIPSSNRAITPTGITSAISAAYSIHSDHNLDTKNRETYFCLTDVDNKKNHFVDIWKMSGDVALSALKESTKKQRSISLAKFINYGEKADIIVPSYTWELFVLDQKRKKHPNPIKRKKYQRLYETFLKEEAYV